MTMVEKVAKAVREAANTPFPLSEYDAECIARAAIEAMREPTGGMVHAGYAVGFCNDTQDIYEAMIDAALKEGK